MSETTSAPAETTETASPGDDLESVLRAAWDEQVARDPDTETAAGTDAKRDETGRFAKAEGAEAPAEAKDTTNTDQPKADAGTDRPDAWSETEWQALSPEAQATVARRERDMHAALVDRATETQEVERYRQAYAPHEQRMRDAGITHPAEALERLLGWEQAVRSNPRDALVQMAAAVGYDLRDLLTDPPATPAAPNRPVEMRDPRVDQMIEESDRAKADRNRAEMARLTAEINAFRADSNHPHFDALSLNMEHLLLANPGWTLKQAYEAAVFADPKLREERLSAERKAAQDEVRKADTSRARAARAASASVRDSAPGGTMNGHGSWKDRSLDDELRAVIGGQV